MHRLTRSGITAGWIVLALSAALPAFAAGDLKITLDAKRVTLTNGKESFASAATARPGELIQYQATYKNSGDASVQKVMATLPIPAGMEYVASSAAPAQVMASLDGKAYAPVPLKRTVKLDDGREVLREVPLAEYRYLRWPLGDLAARSQESVQARVRVSPVSQTSVATK